MIDVKGFEKCYQSNHRKQLPKNYIDIVSPTGKPTNDSIQPYNGISRSVGPKWHFAHVRLKHLAWRYIVSSENKPGSYLFIFLSKRVDHIGRLNILPAITFNIVLAMSPSVKNTESYFYKEQNSEKSITQSRAFEKTHFFDRKKRDRTIQYYEKYFQLPYLIDSIITKLLLFAFSEHFCAKLLKCFAFWNSNFAESKMPMTELSTATTTVVTAEKLGLLPEEFEQIKTILGRVPNFTELSIFSVMWSEHCSYN